MYMFNSGKLRATFLLFAGLFWQHLYAVDFRHYLILQSGGGVSYSYIGSVTIRDEVQSLAAQIFFPQGNVRLEMDIMSDGQTVNLQVDPGGRTFSVTPMQATEVSDFVRTLQSGCGNPSGWLANPGLTAHRFALPDIRQSECIRLHRNASNKVGDVFMRFNRGFMPEVRNIAYVNERLTLNPGTRTSGRPYGVIAQMSDEYLFQLLEMMLVALISPQLVQGRHFTSTRKRKINDPKQKLPLVIEVSEWEQGRQKRKKDESSPPKVTTAQGYYLWILEGMRWVFQQYVAGALPQGFSNSPRGSHGVIYTPLGPKKLFYSARCLYRNPRCRSCGGGFASAAWWCEYRFSA